MFLCFLNSSNSGFLVHKYSNERRIGCQQGFASRFSSPQQIHFHVDTGYKSMADTFIAAFMDLKNLFFPFSLRILFPESNAPAPFCFFSQAMAAELLMNIVNLFKNPSSLSTAFVIMMPQRGHHSLAEAFELLTGVH